MSTHRYVYVYIYMFVIFKGHTVTSEVPGHRIPNQTHSEFLNVLRLTSKYANSQFGNLCFLS